MDYAYFKDNYRLIAVALSRQKALVADSRAIQQIVFQRVVEGDNNTKIRLYTILEKSKETILEFAKMNSKSIVTIYKWLNTVTLMLNYQTLN